MDKRPVGFFDSGLGGLTTVKAFKEILPDENIIYYADTAHFPYGTRDVSDLRALGNDIIEYLKGRDVKAIVIACGTMSTATEDMIDSYGLKIVNALDPAVRSMAEVDGDKALAVLATKASIDSEAFTRPIEKISGKKVYGVACQDFVTLCENGITDEHNDELKKTVENSLKDIKGKVDAVLLGCTHFGLIEKAIANYLPDVRIISASEAAAGDMASYLIENDMTGGDGREEIICSGYEIC